MFRPFERLLDPFTATPVTRPPSRAPAFYWTFVRQAKGVFVASLIITGALSVINALLFVFVGAIVDRMEGADTAAAFVAQNVWLFVAIAGVMLVLDPLLAYLVLGLQNQVAVPKFTNRIRWQNHRYVLRQSIDFFQGDFAGRIANKVLQTGQAVRNSVRESIDAVWQALIFLITTLIVFAEADWRLMIPLLLWTGAYIALLRYFVPRIADASTQSSEAHSALTGRVVDSYTNILTVKLFGHAAREDAFAREGIETLVNKSGTLMRHISMLDLIIGIINYIMVFAVGAVAVWLWAGDAISVGTVAAALGLALRINNMSFWIMFTTTSIAENVGVVRDGIETISVPHAVVDRANAKNIVVPKGEIRFDAVAFNYDKPIGGAERPVIDGLSLTVAPGERVGLVGRSGAGKSTLVQLLLRLHDINAGKILIDGSNVAHVTQESLRSQIGMVTQDTSLLHRSVLDNIRYGRPDATLDEVIAAAKRAQAHDFIETLTDPKGRAGYEAHVGERGVKLSGGQRQRIAIARVLLKDAPILILDEATSALDSEVETAIQEQLFNLMAGKTVIAIAHRLSTIAEMDRLIIMDGGRIVEEGTHAELTTAGGLYARLWAKQSSGFVGA
ncbi:MAG: ABC transporter ATP-binding protein [Pseudomonadota bacterium]